MSETSINIPQLAVFLLATFLFIRWISKSSSTPTAPRSPQTRPLNLSQIEQLSQMFPQLSRRDIAWDLQRNGGNAAATTERALSGRGLDAAPPSFVLPAAPTQPRARTPAKAAMPDLITRYKLEGKVGKEAVQEEEEEEGEKKKWSQDRNERQAMLQRRREEMVLAARRKMEAADKGKGKA